MATFLRVLAEAGAVVGVALVFAVGVAALVAGRAARRGSADRRRVRAVGVGPRTLGRQHADGVGLVAAPVLLWLTRVLGPLARLLVLIGNAITPGRGYRDGPFASEAELRELGGPGRGEPADRGRRAAR